jgi:hypothetical protein
VAFNSIGGFRRIGTGTFQLASGGQAVALMMGGEEVPGATTDASPGRNLSPGGSAKL